MMRSARNSVVLGVGSIFALKPVCKNSLKRKVVLSPSVDQEKAYDKDRLRYNVEGVAVSLSSRVF